MASDYPDRDLFGASPRRNRRYRRKAKRNPVPLVLGIPEWEDSAPPGENPAPPAATPTPAPVAEPTPAPGPGATSPTTGPGEWISTARRQRRTAVPEWLDEPAAPAPEPKELAQPAERRVFVRPAGGNSPVPVDPSAVRRVRARVGSGRRAAGPPRPMPPEVAMALPGVVLAVMFGVATVVLDAPGPWWVHALTALVIASSSVSVGINCRSLARTVTTALTLIAIASTVLWSWFLIVPVAVALAAIHVAVSSLRGGRR